MIEWVFFDVGNVLFNDDPQSYFAFRHVHRRMQQVDAAYTFERLLTDREAHARRGDTWILRTLARRFFSDKQTRRLFDRIRGELISRYDEHHLPGDGVVEMLTALGQRYRLGIIANQPPECRASLARRELLDLFDVVAISEELDLHKPDPELFGWALVQAGCRPEHSVMIGDRYDNDVEPARALAMRTILLRWPGWTEKNWRPDDPQARAFLESCDQVPLFGVPADGPQPDRIVKSLVEVPAAIEALGSATMGRELS